MFTIRILVVLALFVGSAHSFSWDIILGVNKGIEFYNNETLTHKVNIPKANSIQSITYDSVHDRVLFVDSQYPTTSISSFDLTTRKIQTLFARSWYGHYNARIICDPVTEVVFWVHGFSISLYSLNPTIKNAVDGKLLFSLDHVCLDIALDSREGYIYWITNKNIERARLDGSERVVLIDSVNVGLSLAIDEQIQKMYWIEKKNANGAYELSIKSANFYGKDITTLYIIARENTYAYSLAVSKDFIYWQNYNQEGIWQLPKNQSQPVPRKLYTISDSNCWACHRVVVKYTTKEQVEGIKSCDSLQYPNNSKSESLVSICQNYCVQGDCNATAEGQPKCSCKAGYSGGRCEVNACHKHCLNDGVCSINEDKQPICQCTADYDGERCDVSICKDYCVQGNCSVNIDGKAKCSCKDGYSGERCEVNVCYKYCSNNGICSLNEEDEPVCECTAGFEGKRCDTAIIKTGDCAENTVQQVLQDLRSDVKKVLKDVKRILQFFCDRLDVYEAKI